MSCFHHTSSIHSVSESSMSQTRGYALDPKYLFLALGLLGFLLIGFTYKASPVIEFQLSEQILKMGLKYDALAGVMLVLVFTLGAVVLTYSARYLISDTTKARFLYQMVATIISVMLFILASNLLTAFIAWQWIGFNLYLLLNHYHYQSEANRSAKKKFIINRLGDTCFLIAIILCYQFYGTSEYHELATIASKQFDLFNFTFNVHSLILGLVFVAIMTKSAQFPFHFWLPDTMQTPTPVSALMHAGVINAGGALLARLSQAFTQTNSLPYIILFVGISSMITGSILKTAQPDVKKKLAYSTMSQMGYMLMQSALGCFAAAVFHLIAHGFYKATLFLNAGNDLFTASQRYSASKSNSLLTILQATLVTLILLWLANAAVNQTQLGLLVMTFIGIALHQMVLSVLQNAQHVLKLLLLSVIQGILIAYFFLIHAFEAWVELPRLMLINENVEYILCAISIVVYFCSLVIPGKTQFVSIYYLKLSKILQVEKYFRDYLLNPIRFLGDILNQHLLNHAIRKWIFVMLMLLTSALAMSEFFAINLVRATLLVQIMMSLLMANRARILFDTIFLLAIAHVCLFILSCSYTNTPHLEMIVPYLTIFLGLFLVVRQKNTLPYKHKTLVENRLSNWGVCLAISLFLLLGIPGTTSFIFWFNLMSSAVVNPVIVLGLIITNILLAIVVLHALQEHVFNLQNSHEIADNKKWLIYMIYAVIIFSNLYFGIFQLPN